jgi:phage-related tail protein
LAVKCAGTKRDNSPCTATVEPPQRFCWWHDPANADKRRRAASKAGKSKPSRELASIKTRLSDLADDVLADKVDKGVAAVASQVLNVYLRAVSVELRVREQMELIERWEMLEEGLQANAAQRTNGGNRWRGA